jgi:predicted dehydrogenase
MLKIGVIGAGHLGKIHLKLIRELPCYTLLGFFDNNAENANLVSKDLSVPFFNNADELIDACDVIDIVTPTLSHFDYAQRALKKSKHVFIEKPISHTLAEAREILSMATEAAVKVQIGHVERFNPAFIAALPSLKKPMFIEAHRLAEFNPRGTDVPVVLDLMIHDIDVILSIVRSEIKNINTSGVAIISDTPDIANARIEFVNGCVANLTASRISLKNMRKARFFQNDSYISIDFLKKKTEVISMRDAKVEESPFALIIDPGNGKTQKTIEFNNPVVSDTNAIKMELETFAGSILNDTIPVVTVSDGVNALQVALQIMQKLKNHTVSSTI